MPAKKRTTSANLAEDDSGSPELENPDDPPGSQTQAIMPEKTSGQETEENRISRSPSRSETAQEGAPTLERSLQRLLQGKMFKRLPRNTRADLILDLLGQDDEKLIETDEQTVHVPKERGGIKAPPIGGNPHRATAAGIPSRPRMVAPHLLNKVDLHANTDRFDRARRMASETLLLFIPTPNQESARSSPDLDGNYHPGVLAGEDIIKQIEELDLLPESYFREISEARVRAPAIKDVYNGNADVDAFERMCSSVYHHLKLTAIRSSAVRVDLMRPAFGEKALRDYIALV